MLATKSLISKILIHRFGRGTREGTGLPGRENRIDGYRWGGLEREDHIGGGGRD